MTTTSLTKFTRTALAAALAAGTLSALPASAGSIITAGSPVAVGSNFLTTYGHDGYLEFDISAAGQTSGDYNTGGAHDALVANHGPNAASTTTIVQPTYISGFTGSTVNHASGYGYDTISPGNEAGIVGGGSGTIFSFTVGASVPAAFQFGVLSNYTGTASESPTTITLTGSGSTPVSVSDTGTGMTRTGTDFLFNIVGAASGETFTVSTNPGAFISGATFDSTPAAAPEPSQFAGLGLMALGLGALIIRARKRMAALA